MSIFNLIKSSVPEKDFSDHPDYVSGTFTYVENIPDLINVICWIIEKDGPLYALRLNTLSQNKPMCFKFPFNEIRSGALHKHDYIELVYVERGRLGQEIDGKSEIFKKGEIYLIDRGTPYRDNIFNEDSVILFFAISNSFFDKSTFLSDTDRSSFKYIKETVLARKEKYKFIRFSPKARTTKTQTLFEEIIKERLECTPGYEDIVVGYIKRMLDLIVSEYNISLTKSEYAHYNTMLFDNIREYIENNYDTVTGKLLAKNFYYTPEYLNTIIKQHTGMPFSKYLQSVRLGKAKSMLLETDMPVDDIARRVGYTNITFFYNLFFKHYGIRPSEMRKNRSE